jgi:ribosomal protein L11 methyltransferase
VDASGLTEFELMADARSAEALSDALLEAGALSVSIEDAHAQSDREQPIYAEPDQTTAGAWKLNRLHVLLGPGYQAEEIVRTASASLHLAPPPIAAVRRVTEQDWVRVSQAQFSPIQVGRLWIVPSWVDPPDPLALNLRLDPGLAFGTGSHPSTRLCLLWLQAQPLSALRVLDYGCGSGILAIAAAKLGAHQVIGVDIDPLALASSAENSRRNQVRADYTAPGSLALEGPGSQFDVIIANILAGPLIALAPVLVKHLARAGSIALAGVLTRQAPELVRAYRAADARLVLSAWATDGDWVCLAGHR